MLKSHSTSVSIFKKIFFALMLVQVIPIAALLYSIDQRTSEHRLAIEREIIDKAHLINTRIEEWVNSEVKVSQFTRELPAFKQLDIAAMKPILQQIEQQSDMVYVARVDDIEGWAIVRSDDKPLKNYAEREYFQEALRGEMGQQILASGKTHKNPLVCFSLAMHNKELIIHGVITQCVSLRVISRNVAKFNIGETGFASLVNPQNKLIAVGDYELNSQEIMRDMSSSPHFKQRSSNVLYEYMEDGKHFIGIKINTTLGWQLIIQQEYKEAFASIVAAQKKSVLLIGVSILLSLIIAWLLSSRISKPLTALSLYDPLTNIPNRRFFNETLARIMTKCRRKNAHFIVAHVDIRAFKEINDTYGHHMGDIVLQTISARIQSVIGRLDIVARLGGDEFAVIFQRAEPVAIETLAKLLLKTCDDKIGADNEVVKAELNLGFAIYPDHGTTPDELIKAADAAFYTSKNKGEDYGVYRCDKAEEVCN